MTVGTRLAALAGVLVVGAGGAATVLASSALADTRVPSGVVAVDVTPAGANDVDGLAYAFPAGGGAAPAGRSTTTAAARSTTAARSAAPAPVTRVVDGPVAGAAPMAVPVPGCTGSNGTCGLPTCQASNPGCSALTCIATAACTPGINGLGTCAPTGVGGVLGCGLGSPGVNDCFLGLGCGLGGFGLGGCGLFSLSGCGIDRLGFGLGGCGFLGGCGRHSDCGFFGGCGFDLGCGRGGDDGSHHGCGSRFDLRGVGSLRDLRHLAFSSHHGHGSD